MGYGSWVLGVGCAAALGWAALGAQKMLEPLESGARASAAAPMERSAELSDFFTRSPETMGRFSSLSCEPDDGSGAPYWRCSARERGAGSSWSTPFAGARDTRIPRFSFELKERDGKVEASINAGQEWVGFKEAAGAILEVAARVEREQALLNPKESAQSVTARRKESWAKASSETPESVERGLRAMLGETAGATEP